MRGPEIFVELDAEETRIFVAHPQPTVKAFRGEVDLKAIPQGTRFARVSGIFEEAHYSIQTLPPTKGRMLDILAQKSAERQLPGRPIRSAYRVLAREAEQTRVFLEAVSVSELEMVGGRLRVLNLTPSLIVPYPVLIMELLHLCRYPLREDEPIAVLEVRGKTLFFTIVRQNAVAFYRRIPVETPGAQLDEVAWVRASQDLLQTIMFFRQRAHGIALQRLVLCGDPIPKEALARLRESLRGQIREADPLSVPPDLPYPREFVQRYPSLVALSLLPPRYGLALQVPSLVEERRTRLTQMVTVTALIAVLLINGLGYEFLAFKKSSLQEINAILSQEKVRLSQVIDLLESRLEELPTRERYADLLQEVRVQQPNWAAVFYEIASFFPEGTYIRTLNLTRTGKGWEIRIQGLARSATHLYLVRSSEAVRARMAFSPLLQLRQFELGRVQVVPRMGNILEQPFTAVLTIGEIPVEEEEVV